jgi:hypothetical protein
VTELSEIYKDAGNQNIRLFIHHIGFADAATIELNGQYGIFLDPSCFDTLKRYKEALVHEIGHCATGCTHKVSSPLDIIQRHEYKADRWAIERYLPYEALNEAITSGYTEAWELAEYFDLPENFIVKALTYYKIARDRKFGDYKYFKI